MSIVNKLILVVTLSLVQLNNPDLQKIKYRNYRAALNNDSTFNYFIVIEVKNIKTGEIREYCEKENLVKGAYHIENKIGYSDKEKEFVLNALIENNERRFEFKRKKAIKNFTSHNYSIEEFEEFVAKLDKSLFHEKVKHTEDWSMWIPERKQMKMYAHYLFNHGILTGDNGSFSGTLEKISDQQIIYLELD